MDNEIIFGKAVNVDTKYIDILNTNYFLAVEQVNDIYEVSLRHKVHCGRLGLLGIPNNHSWDEVLSTINCEKKHIKENIAEFEIQFFNSDVSDATHRAIVAAKKQLNKNV